jgi:hypothetical protein
LSGVVYGYGNTVQGTIEETTKVMTDDHLPNLASFLIQKTFGKQGPQTQILQLALGGKPRIREFWTIESTAHISGRYKISWWNGQRIRNLSVTIVCFHYSVGVDSL